MSRPWYTTAFGRHYPLLYRHRDREEARRCLELLPRLAPLTSGRPLLDLGCGDGRHLHQLDTDQVTAIGLDLSPDLLACARDLPGPRLSLVRGDMRGLPFRSGSLGGVLSLFTAFGYFGNLGDNAGVVAEVARVLTEDGHWFLDYVNCTEVHRELAAGPITRRRRLECLEVSETRQLNPAADRVLKDVQLLPATGQAEAAALWGVGPEGVHYTESVALFQVDELADLARSFALELVASAGNYGGEPLGDGPRWLLVFRRQSATAGSGKGGR